MKPRGKETGAAHGARERGSYTREGDASEGRQSLGTRAVSPVLDAMAFFHAVDCLVRLNGAAAITSGQVRLPSSHLRTKGTVKLRE